VIQATVIAGKMGPAPGGLPGPQSG